MASPLETPQALDQSGEFILVVDVDQERKHLAMAPMATVRVDCDFPVFPAAKKDSADVY